MHWFIPSLIRYFLFSLFTERFTNIGLIDSVIDSVMYFLIDTVMT